MEFLTRFQHAGLAEFAYLLDIRGFELVVLPDVRAVPTARAIDLSRNKLEALSEVEFWDFHGLGKVTPKVNSQYELMLSFPKSGQFVVHILEGPRLGKVTRKVEFWDFHGHGQVQQPLLFFFLLYYSQA